MLLHAIGVKLPLTTISRFYYQGTLRRPFCRAKSAGDMLRAFWVSDATKVIGILAAVTWAIGGVVVLTCPAYPAELSIWGLLGVGAIVLGMAPSFSRCSRRCTSGDSHSESVVWTTRRYPTSKGSTLRSRATPTLYLKGDQISGLQLQFLSHFPGIVVWPLAVSLLSVVMAARLVLPYFRTEGARAAMQRRARTGIDLDSLAIKVGSAFPQVSRRGAQPNSETPVGSHPHPSRPRR
jgi:hypothetical protein